MKTSLAPFAGSVLLDFFTNATEQTDQANDHGPGANAHKDHKIFTNVLCTYIHFPLYT